MKVDVAHRAEILLSEAEWFKLQTHWPPNPAGIVQVRRMTASWTSDLPRPVVILVGMRVRQDGHPGGRRVTHTVSSWRADGRRVVAQFPDAVVDQLEAHGMVLR
ncbi:hypothetical protein [Kribbella sp. NPDC006257]|uniref:hypothetical protein n=1 Tax=Kribbella sp. NPDC006257 TaxID=3156738 RepID=UPI0033BCA215